MRKSVYITYDPVHLSSGFTPWLVGVNPCLFLIILLKIQELSVSNIIQNSADLDHLIVSATIHQESFQHN